MEFNINEQVKVKLTQYGLDILKQQHDALRDMFPSIDEYTPPYVDENGWSSFQLWSLMDG